MLTQKGINFFTSSWSECDCHLNTKMYDALIKLSGEFVSTSIGVVNRDYSSGLVTVATVFDEHHTDDEIENIKKRIKELLKEEYAKRDLLNYFDENYSIEIYKYDDLEKHGYSGDDIQYCFIWRSILRRQVS